MFSARRSKYKEKGYRQSRKERRKQERAARKAKAAAHFSRKRNISEGSGSREKPQKAGEKRGRDGALHAVSTNKQTVGTSSTQTLASIGSLFNHPAFCCVGRAWSRAQTPFRKGSEHETRENLGTRLMYIMYFEAKFWLELCW